ERRDEPPRLGLARVHNAFLLDLDHAGLGIPAVDRVGGHADPTAVDALHAPHAGVIVKRRALALAPHHDERAVAPLGIAMKKPTRVDVGRRQEVVGVEEVFAALDHFAEHTLHVATSGFVVADRDRLVEASDQLVHFRALPDHGHALSPPVLAPMVT